MLHRQAAASQQTENELAALRQQVVASNERQRNEANAAMSQNSHQSASATISLEAIQRMIAEGVKAQYMQTHYSMRSGYVKPYPLEVDMVPFPSNYQQPQFSKFNGSRSPHEHVAHFLQLARIQHIMEPSYSDNLCIHCRVLLSLGIASWHLVPSELGNKCKMPSSSAFIALKGQ
jgi:hypothetical protein